MARSLELNGLQAEIENRSIKGVKGISSVNEIPGFDIAKGYAMDVLHTVELGVVKQLTNTWLDSKNHCKPFYLPPSSQKKMNSILTGVSLPESFSRRARSLDDRQNFKASEWRNFLLFFFTGYFERHIAQKIL